MKNLKYNLLIPILGLVLIFSSCQEDDLTIGELVTPSNIELSITYLDDTNDDGIPDETAAPGLGSGLVKFVASADGAISFHFNIQNTTKLQKEGALEHTFTLLGNNSYAVTVIAYGSGGISASKTFDVEVLALYEPPADLTELIYATGQKTWKIASDIDKHFGLGPVGGDPFQWYGAAAGEKAHTGMYDDRYTFHEDGTFEMSSGEDGFVFGRVGLIDELGGTGGEAEGDDIIQYEFGGLETTWSLTAPGGAETINLNDLGFFGYYIGGDHKYVIHSRTSSEMILTSVDGNGSFSWWFRLIPE